MFVFFFLPINNKKILLNAFFVHIISFFFFFFDSLREMGIYARVRLRSYFTFLISRIGLTNLVFSNQECGSTLDYRLASGHCRERRNITVSYISNCSTHARLTCIGGEHPRCAAMFSLYVSTVHTEDDSKV
jgi:hypothetical protein